MYYFDYFSKSYYEYKNNLFTKVSDIEYHNISKLFEKTVSSINSTLIEQEQNVKAFRMIALKNLRYKILLKIILPNTIKNDGTVCETRKKGELKPIFDNLNIPENTLPKKKNYMCLFLEYKLREKSKIDKKEYFRRPFQQYIFSLNKKN
jgi:hypothetical protein